MTTKICNGPLCLSKEVPIEDFLKNGKICRKCNCHTTKEYYKKNNRPYRKLKNELKENAQCIECGCKDVRLLEFDHIRSKTINISHSFSKSAIQNEVSNTQFLCVWCHRLKSRQQLDKIKDDNNVKYTITDRPTEGKVCSGKICKGQLRAPTDFYKATTNVCKECQSYGDRLQREANYNFLNKLKLELDSCNICFIKVTESTTCCFDFDHLRDKTTMLSNFVRKNKDTSLDIIEESKKCRLLCCKCHRIVTAKDYNYNCVSVTSNVSTNQVV